MNFEEKFLELALPFFELVEPDDDAPVETIDAYLKTDERIELLKTSLKNLAKGDPASFEDIATFFNNNDNAEFLAVGNAASLPKLLALASNITLNTWGKDIALDAPYRARFLQGDDRIEQPYDESERPLVHYFYNSVDAANSVALIDFRSDPNVSQLQHPDSWSPQGHDLIEAWTIILLLQHIDQVDGCIAVISSIENDVSAVSYLKYHLVMSGNILTLPVPLPSMNHMADIQPKFDAATDYTQFIEPFGMLSEVNSCGSMLDTFLSTYHVLENYMIRSEVSEVLSNTTGRQFQRVRDFKRLGQQTDASEIAHLAKLFRGCWDLMIGPQMLSVSLKQCFTATKADPCWGKDKFDKFLVQLGVLNSSGNQVSFTNGFETDESVQRNFAKLVYAIRCSIVHNKATEFHLSNEELKSEDIRALVIVEMCLPIMQRLAFGLPSSLQASNPIHYAERELKFY